MLQEQQWRDAATISPFSEFVVRLRTGGRTMTANRRQYWRRLGPGTLAAILMITLGVENAVSLQMRESNPEANAIIRGRHAEFVIRFDGPVDHIRSRMEIMQADKAIRVLVPRLDSAPDVLFASGETPPPGPYTLHWQVRSLQGDVVSEGEIPFSVER
jgi:methionine-rich copper-binding protein CopC